MAGMNVASQIGDYAAAVTPSDTADNTFSYLWIGVTGNLAVRTESGQTLTFSNVPVGWFWLRVNLVLSTGTTASSIVGVR
jgi:hypothetical protein